MLAIGKAIGDISVCNQYDLLSLNSDIRLGHFEKYNLKNQHGVTEAVKAVAKTLSLLVSP